jgi:transcriptional regulator with PAS, ATPase and Fis domain
LLRVLQERQIERIGGSRAIPVDVRVIAALDSKIKRLGIEKRRFTITS